jgi:DNA-binding MarR family transcriptional regulator
MVSDNLLLSKIFQSISTLTSLDRKKIVLFEDLKLYPSEIHLLLFIFQIRDTNITRIAEFLGLTKGAISQTLTRLVKKGIIHKETQPHKKNQLYIRFTPKGEKLMRHIIQFRNSLEEKYLNYISTLSNEEKNLISHFLDKMVKFMEDQ